MNMLGEMTSTNITDCSFVIPLNTWLRSISSKLRNVSSTTTKIWRCIIRSILSPAARNALKMLRGVGESMIRTVLVWKTTGTASSLICWQVPNRALLNFSLDRPPTGACDAVHSAFVVSRLTNRTSGDALLSTRPTLKPGCLTITI